MKNTARRAGKKTARNMNKEWSAKAIRESLQEEENHKMFKQYVRGVTQFLRCEFFLQAYNIHFSFDKPGKNRNDGNDASVETNDVYLYCTLSLNDSQYQHWKQKDYEDIVFSICHELIHVVEEPVAKRINDYSPSEKCFLKDQWETVTQQLTKIYMSRVDRRLYDPAFVLRYAAETADGKKTNKRGGGKHA